MPGVREGLISCAAQLSQNPLLAPAARHCLHFTGSALCMDLGLELETTARFFPRHVEMHGASSPASSPAGVLLWSMSPAFFQVPPLQAPKAHTTQAIYIRPSRLPSNLGGLNPPTCRNRAKHNCIEHDVPTYNNSNSYDRCAIIGSVEKEQLNTWYLNLLPSGCSAAVELRIQSGFLADRSLHHRGTR